MAVLEMTGFARAALPKVQTFEGLANEEQRVERRGELHRLRLTQQEVEGLRYVLTDWASDCGVGSVTVHEATVEHEAKAAAACDEAGIRYRVGQGVVDGGDGEDLIDGTQRHHHLRLALAGSPRRSRAERKREKWARQDEVIDRVWQMIKVKGPPRMARPDQIAPAERWADRSSADQRFHRTTDDHGRPVQLPGPCEETLRCWRALAVMARSRGKSLVILNALYGDTPPGLPPRGYWSRTLDLEYRRVCRYAPASGGNALALEAMVHIDKHRRPGEGDSGWRARVASAQDARRARLGKIGEECERLIVTAAVDYRAAVKAVP